MHDPYLYKDTPVLINKLGIKNQEMLDNAEADYVVYRLKDLVLNPLSGDYHSPHLLNMHEYIFQDIFEWAGLPRTISIYKEEDILGGQSIEYSDPFDILHDLHHVLSDMRGKKWKEMGFPINRKLFEENSRYVRTALVAYNAYFSDGSNFSKKEYLEKIVYDALE
jgi:cell filamentation protein